MAKPEAKILVVEDEQPLRDALREVLNQAGYQIETAADGEAGLAAYYHFHPDLVILDVVLPKENGYRISRAIKSSADLSPGKKAPPVLLITGRRLDEDRERESTMMEFSKADAVMYKPFPNADLLEKVQALLGSTVKRT